MGYFVGMTMHRFWRIVWWTTLGILGLIVALFFWRLPAVLDQERTAEVVQEIQSQKLTMEDVDGKHLPPPPDPALVDATVEGIDANGNGIRDDVELAIFKKYPNDIKVRAAELQYAMALQLELTKVFNMPTWKAATDQVSRAHSCVAETYPRDDIDKFFDVMKAKTEEVEMLVHNTDARNEKSDSVSRYTTSYGLPDGVQICDLVIK